MGTFPPIKKTLEGLIEDTRERLTLVERRLGIPQRIGPLGQEVSDWDDATAAGFYWGNQALNQPVPSQQAVDYWVGITQVFAKTNADEIEYLQTLRRPDVPGGPTYERYWRTSTGVWTAWTAWESGAGSTAALGTSDLDTVVMPGVYYQSTFTNATLARNYPDTLAGTLEVVVTNTAQYLTQTYTARADVGSSVRIWVRGKFGAGAWQPWRIISGQDTGWVSSGAISIASGFSMTGYDIRRIGNDVILRYINFTRTGAAMNGAAGDIGNTTFATITDSQFWPTQGSFMLHTGNSGRVLAGNVDASGNLIISAIAAGLTDSSGVIPTNAVLSLAGRWTRD